MINVIKKDLYRYVGERSRSWLIQLRYIAFTPGFQYIYFYRHATHAKNKLSRMFWLFGLRLCMFKTGIQIPYQTHIGEGLKILHFGTIVINPQCRIGKNFNISHGCTVGVSLGKCPGAPVIGNNVCMQPNSIVVGGVTIGNNVLIAPGAFVDFDVPSNAIVLGNPGKIIAHKSSSLAAYQGYTI